MARTNIILFGESGAGKSSVVNMLSANERTADISSGARGCTFQSSNFDIDVLGQPATIWDTAGLDEGDAGRVPKVDAIVQLYRLVRSLSDGVGLLMFVMRAPRIKSSVPHNWKFFHEVICQSRVPIVIVITGLEQEENMDQWYWNNKATFQEYGIYPAGFACVTASRGKPMRRGGGHVFDDEYEESKEKIQRLIRSTCLASPWHVPPAEWFKTIVRTTVTYRERTCRSPERIEEHHNVEVGGDTLYKLIHVGGMTEEEAREVAEKLRGT